MGWCQGCGAFVGRQQEDCPSCGAPTRKSDKKSMGFDAAAERMRRVNEAVRTADYECRKFGLEPRGEHETEWDYVARINIEKTAKMFKPREREPGEDG